MNNKLLEAVDIVCGNCPYGNDEECQNCNVRKMCDSLLKNETEESL